MSLLWVKGQRYNDITDIHMVVDNVNSFICVNMVVTHWHHQLSRRLTKPFGGTPVTLIQREDTRNIVINNIYIHTDYWLQTTQVMFIFTINIKLFWNILSVFHNFGPTPLRNTLIVNCRNSCIYASTYYTHTYSLTSCISVCVFSTHLS